VWITRSGHRFTTAGQSHTELRRLQNLLISGEDLDPRILTDFRDALNHVRNTAWSAHQYIASKSIDHDSTSVLSVLAGERIRVAYQLCQAIQADLKSTDIKFQTGQLIQLSSAVKDLAEQLVEGLAFQQSKFLGIGEKH